MSSTLRFGLSRPAASHLLRPQPPAPSTTPSPAAAAARAFSSTPSHPQKREARSLRQFPGLPRQGIPTDGPLPIPKPYARDAHIPPYPYGARAVYKQSNAGLHGHGRIRFGNNVTPKHNVKTPRVWRPNVHRKRLWSFALGCFVQTRVTVRVLRTIDKAGGLDNYLLGTKAARIKELGPWGWKLRWRIMQSDVIKERFFQERVALGLVSLTEQELHEQWLAEKAYLAQVAELNNAAEDTSTLTKEGLMAETDRMIQSEEDFPIGEDLEVDTSELAQDESFVKEEIQEFGTSEPAKDEGFMKEQRP